METQTLNATLRTGEGKGAARRTRAEGFVPAIMYGPDVDPVQVKVEPRELRRMLTGEYGVNAIFTLAVDGKGEFDVMVRDYQMSPVDKRVLHTDFVVVDREKTVVVDVPIALVGKAKGVVKGGRIRRIRRFARIRCLPDHIPPAIEYDITDLDLKDRALASQITPPEGVEIILKSDYAIAQVMPPRAARPKKEKEKKKKVGEEGEEAAEEGAEAPAA